MKFEEAKETARKDPIYYPDAVPAIEALKAMGLTLCLSTGYGAGQKAKTMELRTGKKFFKYTFSEPALGVLKTEPEYYRKALRLAKAKPGETVSVGDTPLSDIRPAKLVGIKTIWVNRNQEPRPLEEDQIRRREGRQQSLEGLHCHEPVLPLPPEDRHRTVQALALAPG